MDKETSYSIEDFLLDDAFVAMVKRNSQEEVQAFIEQFPGQQQTIRDAIMLIRTLKVKESTTPFPGLVETDYRRLLRRVRNRRRGKWLVRAVAAAAAACIAGVLFFVPEWRKTDADMYKNDLLSQLDSVDVRTGQVQLIAGTSQFQVEDNDIVLQTENSVVVGGKTIDEANMEQTEYLQVVVPYGKRSTLTLNDGTVVWINSGTTVIYPRRFKGKRELFIDGEAYLEVAKAAKPFIVHTKKFDIAVLGTKFNVHSFEGEPAASVVLVEGSVEVATGEHKNKLSPNEGIFYDSHTVEIKEVDTYSYICWKDGFIKLEGETLDVIFGKLARYYKVEFIYDQAMAGEIYAGKLNLSDSIETILHSLSLSTPFTFSREDDRIRLQSIKE
jgi:ferric-dicitrate binding protein FerR (iron transport regulator)